jgi:hypothetical protein
MERADADTVTLSTLPSRSPQAHTIPFPAQAASL